jgi:hypothetical protein
MLLMEVLEARKVFVESWFIKLNITKKGWTSLPFLPFDKISAADRSA